MKKHILLSLFALLLSFSINAQTHQTDGHDHSGHNHDDHDHSGHNHDDHSGHNHADHAGHDHGANAHDDHGDHGCGWHHREEGQEFTPKDVAKTAFHHISDANVYSIGPWQIPLPCILYAPETGWDVFLSNKFKFNSTGHGNGHSAYKGYILDAGSVKRITDSTFPRDVDEVALDGIIHEVEEGPNGKDKTIAYACIGGTKYRADSKSIADAGVFGGGISSFYDFSITKNVTSMILVFFGMLWLFLKVAKRYVTRNGMAPKGIQSFIESIFVFIQDEVAKPFLGAKYLKYQPFLMAIFFFVLGLNLWGQIPFFGGANVSGNLGVTMVLAIFAFFVVNLSGNKHYWEHIFAMPGVPKWVLTILTPVEFLGIFIKPLTLMLRLFANITAGHMVIIVFVSLIFMFSKGGTSYVGGLGTAVGSTLLTIFMMAIELLVAFIQAFVFTILTASYLGAAVEEPHHH